MGFFTRKSKSPYNEAATSQLRSTSPSDTSAITTLISSGADPNALLIPVATAGCVPALAILLSAGADPDRFQSKPKWHETPLLAAIHEVHIPAVEYLVSHGANIDGSWRTGAPLAVAIFNKDFKMLQALLEMGADPNKKTMGWITPMRGVEAKMMCTKHDIRKRPVKGCEKCEDRLLMIRMMGLLRRHGGRPIVEGVLGEGGTGMVMLDAYVDLIAHVEKWEERGTRWAKHLGDVTYNDPTVRGMLEFMIGGALGQVGIELPPTSVGSLFDLPDFGGFERIETKGRNKSAKYRDEMAGYARELMELEDDH
ncbi:ankyrin repeat-containing domain protein [Lasiosphaeris hirsuta]|uniref:Ankyrin repeat-containing domain protein n=1 Tax=Lasiosphaeris hirsuta TaxID=260670 RepID=A0AA40DXN8_9PEZI|nr:ankyrin repeat-containing domain protein [Lasiosphaeris hirsuta]